MKALRFIVISVAAVGIGVAAGSLRLGCPEDGASAPTLHEGDARLRAILDDGIRLIDEGKPVRGRAALEDALRIDPRNPQVSRHIAASYRKELNLKKAMTILDQAVESHPRHAGLHLERGMTREAMGEYGEARADYLVALEALPDDGQAHLRLGFAELKLNRFQEALIAGRRALLHEPVDPDVHLLLGTAYAEIGETAAAEVELRQCLLARPEHLEARYRLAHLLIRSGKTPEGQRELKRSARIADHQIEIGRLEELVRTYYREEFAEDPSHAQLFALSQQLGREHLGALQFQKAERVSVKAAALRPGSADPLWLSGMAQLGQGRVQAALRTFQQASAADPDAPRFQRAVALAEKRIQSGPGRNGSLIELVEDLLGEEPE
ncbi:MAG: tetratricopeptide repeat protein [Planctomycetota bacterium]|nr:tetratricopeptide repeat protein [Planctomycetota bacterium]